MEAAGLQYGIEEFGASTWKAEIELKCSSKLIGNLLDPTVIRVKSSVFDRPLLMWSTVKPNHVWNKVRIADMPLDGHRGHAGVAGWRVGFPATAMQCNYRRARRAET